MNRLERLNQSTKRVVEAKKASSSDSDKKLNRLERLEASDQRLAYSDDNTDVESIINGANSAITESFKGWNSSDLMTKNKDKVRNAYTTLDTYRKKYDKVLPDEKQKQLEEVSNNYKSVLDGWDDVAGLYSQFQNAKAYEVQKAKWEYSDKYKGYSYDEIQQAIAKAETREEQDYLKNYTEYSTYDDYQKALGNNSANEALNEAFNRYMLDNPTAKYDHLSENPDFETLSKFDANEGQQYKDGEYAVTAYNYRWLNGAEHTDDYRTSYWETLYGMSEYERSLANYIYKTQGQAKWKEYLDDVYNGVGKRQTDEMSNSYAEWSSKNALNGSLATLANTFMRIGSAPYMLGESISGALGGYEPYAAGSGNQMQRLSGASESAIREKVGSTFDNSTTRGVVGNELLKIGYGAVSSGIASRLGQKIFGPAYNVVMGMQAFSDTYTDLTEKGYSEEEATEKGLVAGATEFVWETVGMDWAFGKKSVIKDANGFVKALQMAGAEGLEEVMGNLTNAIYQDARFGQNADLQRDVQDLKAKGYSHEDAVSKVRWDFAKETAEEFLSAALSTAPGGVMNAVNTSRQGRYVSRDFLTKNTGKDATNYTNYQAGNALNELRSEKQREYKEAEKLYKKDARLNKQGKLSDEELALSEDNLAEASYGTYAAENNAYASPEETYVSQKLRKKYNLAQKTAVDGAEVSIKEVKTENGKTMLVTDKGEFNAKNVTLSVNDAKMVDYVSRLNDKTLANTLVSNYKGQKFGDYVDLMETAYAYGKNKVGLEVMKEDLKNASIAPELLEMAYTDGLESKYVANVQEEQKLEAINKEIRESATALGFNGTKLDDSGINYKDLTMFQKTWYGALKASSDLGMRIKVINDYSSTSKNGEYVSDDKGGYIVINLAARYGKTMSFDTRYVANTTAHEFAHYARHMEELSGESGAYTTLVNTLRETFGETEWNRLLQVEMERNPELDLDGAEDELVARACEDMLLKKKSWQEIFGNTDATTTQKIKEAVEKFLDAIGELLEKLFKNYSSNSEAARLLSNYQDKFEEVRQLWTQAMNEAIATQKEINANESQKSMTEEATEALKSGSEEKVSEVIDEAFDKAPIRNNAKPQSSIKLDDSLSNKTLKYYENAVKNGQKYNFTVQELNNAIAQRKTLAFFMKQLSKFLPDDSMEGNILVGNNSYAKSAEHALICVRSLVTDWFMDRVSEEVGHPLSNEEQIICGEILAGKVGNQRECMYCYVASDRKAFRAGFNQYYAEYERVINDVSKNKSKYSKEYNAMRKNFDEWTAILEDKPKRKKFLKEHANELSNFIKYLNGREASVNMYDRFLHFMEEGMNDRHSLQIRSLSTKATRDEAIISDETQGWFIKDAVAWGKGAFQPKSMDREIGGKNNKVTTEYISYNGHILKESDKLVEELNKEYGLRMYSFSDYVPAFLLEDMQVVCDAAARGLKMLAYTKDINFAKIFGSTGMGINVSVFGYLPSKFENEIAKYRNAYLADKNDDTRKAYVEAIDKYVVADAMQGAGNGNGKNNAEIWKPVKDIRNTYENVGAVFVATNDDLVEWALAQDWIDVVIPYHLVRAGQDVADWFNFKNYSREQSDKKMKDWDSSYEKSIFPVLHGNDRAKYEKALADNHLTHRFASWADNPNYMKLVNETRMSYNDMQPVKPIFDDGIDLYDENGGINEESNVMKEIERIKTEGQYGLLQGVDSLEEQERLLADAIDNAKKKVYTWETGTEEEKKAIRSEYSGSMNSNKVDEAYMEAYDNDDEETMQSIIDSEAKKAGYKYKAYHHTENLFTVFDRNKARKNMDIQGFFFSADADAESEYGSMRYDVYLKMQNPYIINSKEKNDAIPVKFGTDNYGVKVREWLQSKGYDSVIRKAEYYGSEADEYIVFDSNQIKSADSVTFSSMDDYGEVVLPSERFNESNPDIRYSEKVTDKSKLDSLNEEIRKGEYYVTYKSMSFWGYDEEGNALLRSPMAEFVDGKLSDAYVIRKDGKLNWYKSTENIDEKTGVPKGLIVKINSDEKDKYPKEDVKTYSNASYVIAYKHPELIAEDWSNCYYPLIKRVEDGTYKNGEVKYKDSPVPARYAPYEHSSNMMLNDQFESAWRRANLVTVKMYVPKSEASGAFRANYAKDSTGWNEWHSGIVASNIRKQKPSFDRQVFLSRFAAPVEIIPDSKVAKEYKKYLDGTDIKVPDNVVSPNLLNELKKAGVSVETTGKIKFEASNDFGLIGESNSDIRYSNKVEEGYSEIDKTTLGFTDERIDTLLDGGHYGSTNKEYAQAYITYMSPDDYLKLTTGYGQRALERVSQWDEQSNGKFSAEEFAGNYNDVPIQLNIDEENYEVIGHEGRHRMAMLKKAGFKKVPVLVFNYDNKYGKKRVPSMNLMPQWFQDADDALSDADRVEVTDLIPFSQGNADLIKETFGSGSNAVRFNDKSEVELGTLFSGADTFAYALDGLIHTQYAAENRPEIVSVYKQNHGGYVFDDVMKINVDEMPDVQHLHVSPPCVNFSSLNNERGEKPIDKKLAGKIAEIIKAKRPRAITVENVAGYADSESMKIILNALKGYKSVDVATYKDSEYGGFTTRERVILRAMRDENLPAVESKVSAQKGWIEAVGYDYLDTLPNAAANPRMIESLKNLSGIDVKRITKPLFVFGESYANKTFGHAYADRPVPTIFAKSGASRIFMPNGTVKEATPDFLAKVMGIDGFKLPDSVVTARRVIGNGIPANITRSVMGPVIAQIKADNERRIAQGEQIRFNEKVDDDVYNFKGEAKRLEKENKILKKDLERLKDKIKLNKTLTHGGVLKESDLDTVARWIVKRTRTNVSKQDIIEGLKDVYGYVLDNSSTEDGQIDYQIFMGKAYDLAQRIVSDERERFDIDYVGKDIIDDIRRSKIKLTDAQIKEAKYYWGENYRDYLMGRITTSKNGTPIDVLWEEWASAYPWVFSSDVSDKDMIVELSDIYDDIKDSSRIEHEYNKTEETKWLAEEIYEKFWNVSTIMTEADKTDKKIKLLNMEHRAAMEDLKAANKDAIEAQKLADAMYYGSRNAETKRVYEQRLAEQKKKFAESVKKVRDTKNAQFENYKKNRREFEAKRREQAEKRKVIERITANAMTLMDWMNTNSAKKHVPDVLKTPVGNLLRSIDMSSKRLVMEGIATQKDLSVAQSLFRLNQVLDRNSIIEETNSHVDLPADFTKDVSSLYEAIEALERKNPGENVLQLMSVEELENLNTVIKVVKSAVTNVNKILSSTNAHSMDYYSKETIREADVYGEKKGENVISKAKDFLDYDNALPQYVFNKMGNASSEIFNLLKGGWNKLAFNMKQIKDFAESVYTKDQAKDWGDKIHEISVNDNGVEKKIKITVPQIMSLYCLSKREHALPHITQGGIRIANIKEKWGKTTIQADKVTLTTEELSRVIGLLTDEQRSVADSLQKFMNTVCSDWGNEVTMKRFGIRLFNEQNYFPIKSDSNMLSREAKDPEQSIYSLLNMSFTKELTPNAKNTIVVDSIFKTFAVHASDMAKYNSIALPVLDTVRWFNYKEDDLSVKRSIEKAYGTAAKGYVMTLLQDVNGATGDKGYDGKLNRFAKTYKTAAVAGRIQTALLQPLSYIRAGFMIDNKYLVKAFRKKSQMEKCQKYSGIACWKSMGNFYDTNVSRSLEKMIAHDGSFVDELMEESWVFGLKFAGKMDDLTWGYLWNAVEAEISDTTDLTYDSDEYVEAVTKRFEEIIYNTQVVDSTLTKSQIMRSKGGLTQTFTAFMSEPTVSLNMLWQTASDFINVQGKEGIKSAMQKHGKTVARAVLVYTISSVVESALRSAVSKFRGTDDDDETMLEDIWNRVKDELNVLNKIPWVADVWGLFEDIVIKKKYFSDDRMDIAWASQMFRTFNQISKAIDEGGANYKLVYNVLDTISKLSGLPFSTVLMNVKNFWNNSIGLMYPNLRFGE